MVELLRRRREAALLVAGPVALAADLGLDVRALAVKLGGDLRLGADAGFHGLAGLQGDERFAAGDALSVLHVNRADDALPGRAQANHAGGRLEISARELDARKSAARDEDAGGGEDYGENRDDERRVARRSRQQAARFQDVPVAVRDLGRGTEAAAVLRLRQPSSRRRRHARLRLTHGSVVRPAYRGLTSGLRISSAQIERPRRNKTMGRFEMSEQ